MTTRKRHKELRQAIGDQNRERPAYLVFWFKNGACCRYDARVPADTKVSIGRTDSKRALGFIVKQGDKSLDFVLDKDQVAELAAYLGAFSRVLLKPLGRKKPQLSIAAMVADRD
jgi:hypothetical protein